MAYTGCNDADLAASLTSHWVPLTSNGWVSAHVSENPYGFDSLDCRWVPGDGYDLFQCEGWQVEDVPIRIVIRRHGVNDVLNHRDVDGVFIILIKAPVKNMDQKKLTKMNCVTGTWTSEPNLMQFQFTSFGKGVKRITGADLVKVETVEPADKWPYWKPALQLFPATS